MKASKLGAMAVIVAALSSVGCAIHVQGPVREVARDYTDRDFYDRSFAPSPSYQSLVGAVVATPGPAAFAPSSGSRFVPAPDTLGFAGGLEAASAADAEASH
ncbi:MAG: hypothetical protein IT373_03705 [Polyangiaceae bacterium]|nr:hypothetical protein [Polyangiaceae bacterium]